MQSAQGRIPAGHLQPGERDDDAAELHADQSEQQAGQAEALLIFNYFNHEIESAKRSILFLLVV